MKKHICKVMLLFTAIFMLLSLAGCSGETTDSSEQSLKETEYVTEVRALDTKESETPAEVTVESITEKQVELPIVEVTEAPTEVSTEAQTEEVTEPETTVPETETPTVVETTETPTEAPTEPETTTPETETATVEETTEAPTEAPTEATQEGKTYVLNTNTKKFHKPTCSSAGDIKPKNYAEYVGTAEEVEAMGYEGCKRCKPY